MTSYKYKGAVKKY